MHTESTDELAQILWDYNNLGQKIQKSDVVICLGSHDQSVAKRAIELYLQKFAKIIVFSGGFGRITSKTARHTEAETYTQLAIKSGIPATNILIESKSTNTSENLRFSVRLLKENIIEPISVILITKPYMERRAYATWEKLYPNIGVLVSSPQVDYKNYAGNSGVSKTETINIMVGDTQRIKVYAQKGFMEPQKIPDKVWNAYRELVKRGYDKYLI